MNNRLRRRFWVNGVLWFMLLGFYVMGYADTPNILQTPLSTIKKQKLIQDFQRQHQLGQHWKQQQLAHMQHELIRLNQLSTLEIHQKIKNLRR